MTSKSINFNLRKQNKYLLRLKDLWDKYYRLPHGQEKADVYNEIQRVDKELKEFKIYCYRRQLRGRE